MEDNGLLSGGEREVGPPERPRRKRNWLLISGMVATLAFALGVVGVVGASNFSTALAAAAATPSATPAATNISNATPGPGGRPGGGPRGQNGPQGQCEWYTVSSVSGSTITAKAQDGSSVTIHTTSSTKYTKAGKSASASDVTAGAKIMVQGSHASDGSITATSVDIQ